MPGPNAMGFARPRFHLGGGSSMSPSRCMASSTTRAIMSLSPPSGLTQPMRRQNSIDRARRDSRAGLAMSVRSSAISAAVKSRPW